MCLRIPFVNSFLHSFKQPSVHWTPDMLGPEEAKEETLSHSLGEGNSHSCNSSRVIEGGSRGHWAGYVPKTSGWVGRHPRGSLGRLINTAGSKAAQKERPGAELAMKSTPRSLQNHSLKFSFSQIFTRRLFCLHVHPAISPLSQNENTSLTKYLSFYKNWGTGEIFIKTTAS